MRIAALAATRDGERRTPLIPATVRALVDAGHEISVESGVGAAAGFDDAAFQDAGASVGASHGGADLLVAIEPPSPEAVEGAAAVLGLLEPLDGAEGIGHLAATGATLFAFELLPRTTRAQAADALSSQATIAGYQAALEAARLSDRIFPMLTTAAGTVRPAEVLVLGAGVAGLQAIATARRLGAVVAAFDVRGAASEQVESLGARFVTVDMEAQDERASGGYARALADDDEARVLAGLLEHVASADAVVTTAAVPGRPAPRLVSADMVASMRPGAVVVDGAGATGGNCDVSQPGRTVVHDGVIVTAPLDLPSRKPNHASQLYARNVAAFVGFLTGGDGALDVDADDDLVVGSMVARDGRIVHERVLERSGTEGHRG